MIAFFIRAFHIVLDTILPPKARMRRIEAYTLADLAMSAESHDACGHSIITLMRYREHAVEDCIRALKYDHSGYAAQLLASALAEYLYEEIAQLHLFSTKPVMLVPVPLHPDREHERGFNQIERVLTMLPADFQNGTLARVDTTLLSRTRATNPQTRLSRTKRLVNVRNAFTAANTPDAHIILIDDVTTTGATLSEAAKPLKGASVTLLALAHA